MSSPATPPPSPAANPSPRTPFRFSLFTLLSLTTLAGVVSAIIFSKHWFPDERLLLSFWFAGLIVGISFGRARGTNGVISGCLGSVVGCLLAATMIANAWPTDFAWQNTAVDAPYFAFVVGVGWFAALAIGLSYRAVTAGRLGRLWFNRQARVALLAVSACAIGALVLFQFLQPRPWLPSWDIKSTGGRLPAFELSPHGDLLYVHYRALDIIPADAPRHLLFELNDKGAHSRPSPVASKDVVFSPDGKLILGVDLNTCRLFDLKSGDQLRMWTMGGYESIQQVQFSPNGEQLLMITMSHKIQRLYVFDIGKSEIPRPELFAFTGFMHLDPTGELLVKVHLSQDETGEMRAEIVNRQDGTLLGEISDLPFAGHVPEFSAGGEHVAFDNRVWKRTGGKATPFASHWVGLLQGNRAVVIAYPQDGLWQQVMPDWLLPMPFVRHLGRQQFFAELQVVDIETGQIFVRSPAYHLLNFAKLSSDGKVVACASVDDEVRVWKIPEP